jgi:predicted ArsR family transcriptional regulator
MTEDETWEDINERVQAEWKAETTPFERVYEIVEQTHDGQSAATIAERASVSEPTARRHLNALVSTGFASTTQDGRTTLYSRNQDCVLIGRIQELRETTTDDELLASIKELKSEIREYESRHDAHSPAELARTLSTEATEEWEDVTAWRTAEQNLAIAQAALAYGEASDRLAA